MKGVLIGNHLVRNHGQMELRTGNAYIIAEIGINHNGNIDKALELIEMAADAGANAVKFQKRTIDVVYTAEELAKPRENPFGKTNGDLKRHLEFNREQYEEIAAFCKRRGIDWAASPWDEASADFLAEFDVPFYKVASASLTDDNLLRHVRSKGKPVVLSTGMSSLEQIGHAVEVLGREDLILMACTSTYPTPLHEVNLRQIDTLRRLFPDIPIGFSSHVDGPVPALIAASMGACMIEAHVTLSRSLWGSDQAASLEPTGFGWLCKHVNSLPIIMGDGVKRVYDSELPIRAKLRRIG